MPKCLFLSAFCSSSLGHSVNKVLVVFFLWMKPHMLILPCISSYRFFCTANQTQRHVAAAAAESTALRQEKNIAELSEF